MDEAAAQRVTAPEIPFFGAEIFEMAAVCLLRGENVLLSGAKATGKNVLTENLAFLFGRRRGSEDPEFQDQLLAEYGIQ